MYINAEISALCLPGPEFTLSRQSRGCSRLNLHRHHPKPISRVLAGELTHSCHCLIETGSVEAGGARAQDQGKWLGAVPVGFERDDDGYLDHRQPAAFGVEFVSLAGEFLLLFEEFDASRSPFIS